MTPSVLSVVEIFMSSVTVTVLFPYCDILIFGWTIPNISVKRLITKQKTPRHGVMQMDIYFSLSGHNSHSDSLGVDFTESQRLHTPSLTEERSQNRSSAPHPTNLQMPVCVAKHSREQCQPHFMSDLWTQLRHVDDYFILSSHIHNPRARVYTADRMYTRHVWLFNHRFELNLEIFPVQSPLPFHSHTRLIN